RGGNRTPRRSRQPSVRRGQRAPVEAANSSRATLHPLRLDAGRDEECPGETRPSATAVRFPFGCVPVKGGGAILGQPGVEKTYSSTSITGSSPTSWWTLLSAR